VRVDLRGGKLAGFCAVWAREAGFFAGAFSVFERDTVQETFARVFAALKPEEFRACFIEWAQGLRKLLEGVIAIDGKTLCGSHDDASGKPAIPW
jgi:hypothetical protein